MPAAPVLCDARQPSHTAIACDKFSSWLALGLPHASRAVMITNPPRVRSTSCTSRLAYINTSSTPPPPGDLRASTKHPIACCEWAPTTCTSHPAGVPAHALRAPTRRVAHSCPPLRRLGGRWRIVVSGWSCVTEQHGGLAGYGVPLAKWKHVTMREHRLSWRWQHPLSGQQLAMQAPRQPQTYHQTSGAPRLETSDAAPQLTHGGDNTQTAWQ